nr:putative transposase (putative), gypsy type [Tanacetum cinerariifolium]
MNLVYTINQIIFGLKRRGLIISVSTKLVRYDFLLRKVAPLALPREGDLAIKLGCESGCRCRMHGSHGRGSPYYPVGTLTFFFKSHVMSLALFGLVMGDCLSCSGACSARMRTGYDPCRAAELMLLAAVCRSSQLFIFPYFHRLVRGLDTRLDLNVFEFFLRGFLLSFRPTVRFLSQVRSALCYFGIPTKLRLELPDRNAIIKDSLEGKIGMYTRFIKFANYRIPLSKFLLCILEYYQINLSQLSVTGAANVSHFEFMCHAFSRIPTVEIGLLDFVKSADPFKVRVGERTLADNEDELNVNFGKRKKRVDFVFGSPPVNKARAEGIVIFYSRPSTAGKSPSTLRRLSRQNEQPDTGSGYAAPTTEDVISSSVTPTHERVLEDASHDNVRTRPPSGHFVILSSGSADTDILASPQVIPPVTSASTGVNAPVAESVDRLEKSEAEAAEVIELHKRMSDLEATVSIKVGELASFYTKNVGLVERVSALESERDGLKNQLVGEGWMREEFVSQQDAAERRFTKHAVELDTRIADVRRDMDNDLYSHMLTAIAGRRWVVGHGFRLAVYKCACSVECRSAMGKVILIAINKGIKQGLKAGIVHRKAGRSLAQVEAYDPEVDGKYVTADDQGNKDVAPEFSWFQPSIDQVDVPIYFESDFIDHKMLLSDAIPAIRQSVERRGLCSPSSCAPGGTSSPAPSYDSSLGITDYQVSTLVLAGNGGSAN